MDNWLRNNNIIRIVAIVVGILLWVIVRLDVQNSSPTQTMTVSQRHTDVSIQVEGLDEDRFILRSIEPEKISLTVIGTTNALRRLNDNYRVVLDLSDALPGATLMPLTTTGFPNNVEVVLDPPNVTVTLDEIIQKEVPVTIDVVGTPEEGYIAGVPILQPNRVNVTVAGSDADQVASVVGVLNIDGASETVKEQVRVVALDQNGAELDLDLSPAVVEVEVPITLPFKKIPLEVTLEGNVPPGLAVDGVEQSVSEVTVYAPQAYLDSLDYYDGWTIDLSGLTETSTLEFDIPLKPGVQKVEPAAVTAEVRIVEAENRLLTGVPLTINGMNDAYEYSILPSDNEAGTGTNPGTGEGSGTGEALKAIDVSVEASPSVIADVEPEEVQAVVDVRNLPPGTYELDVNYSLPSFVKPASDAVRTLSMEIREKGAPATTEPEGPNEEPPPEAESPEEDTGTGDETGEDPAAEEEDTAQREPDAEEEPSAGTEQPPVTENPKKTVTNPGGTASNRT